MRAGGVRALGSESILLEQDGLCFYWNGVLELPVLEEEAFSDLLVLSPDIWDFETSLMTGGVSLSRTRHSSCVGKLRVIDCTLRFGADFCRRVGLSHSSFFLWEERERGRRSLPLAKSDAPAVVRETIENLGYECVLTRFVTEQHDSTLQIFIDSIGGILVKDCEIVSKAVVKKIDEMDPAFLEKFSIEVSSPGIERPLFTIDDYIRFQGKTVRDTSPRTCRGETTSHRHHNGRKRRNYSDRGNR
jgi:ribosome maturation factor RimP